MVAGGRSLLLCSLLLSLSLLVEGRFTRLPVCEGLVGRTRFVKESNAQLYAFLGPRILEKGNSEGYSFLSCYHVFFTPTLCGLETL